MNDTAALPRLGTGQVLAPRRGGAAQVDLALDRLARLPVSVADVGHPKGEQLLGHDGDGLDLIRRERRDATERILNDKVPVIDGPGFAILCAPTTVHRIVDFPSIKRCSGNEGHRLDS